MKPVPKLKTRKISLLVKDLDDVHGLYIRARDADAQGICTCITCSSRHPWDDGRRINSGHCISRRHQATKYDEKNVHAQCFSCNKWGSGKALEYGFILDLRYGQGTSWDLHVKSLQRCHRTRYDYEVLFAHFKTELVRIAKSKGLTIPENHVKRFKLDVL